MTQLESLTRTLEHFASEQTDPRRPQVVTIDGRDAVVLGQIEPDVIEVWQDEHVCAYPTTTEAVEVTDMERREPLLGLALAQVSSDRRSGARAQNAQREANADVLAQIRAYAITRHEAGDICRGGLDEFLYTFDLPTYGPRVRVHYTIRGSYEVSTRDEDDAWSEATSYLGPSLTGLSDVDHESATCEVEVIDVERVAD